MRILLPAIALLLTAPAASAHHWTNDADWNNVGDSACNFLDPVCVVDYACTGGAPPQAVDLALYCAFRAAGEAGDIAFWVPLFLWDWAVDFPLELAEEVPGILHNALQGDVDDVNFILCTEVWSFFCTNPIVIPEHIPINDPAGERPPALASEDEST